MSKTIMTKPVSQACEKNSQVIFEVIQSYFQKASRILEVGSGTGQHAVFFAERLPHLFWQTADRVQNHEGINLWIDDYIDKQSGSNIGRPLNLDVTKDWPTDLYSGLFSANTTHIMPWEVNKYFFVGTGKILEAGSYFCLYGPFNENNQFTSESNQRFDEHLKSQDPLMGIRNRQDVEALAEKNDLIMVAQHQMPSNNLILVFQKK